APAPALDEAPPASGWNSSRPSPYGRPGATGIASSVRGAAGDSGRTSGASDGNGSLPAPDRLVSGGGSAPISIRRRSRPCGSRERKKSALPSGVGVGANAAPSVAVTKRGEGSAGSPASGKAATSIRPARPSEAKTVLPSALQAGADGSMPSGTASSRSGSAGADSRSRTASRQAPEDWRA